MTDDLPHIFISRAARSKYFPILPSDIADATVDNAAVDGHLLAILIFQNHVRPHSNIVFAFIHSEIHQNIGVLHQITGISEHRICNALLIGVVRLGVVPSQNQWIATFQIVRPCKHGTIFQQLIAGKSAGNKIIFLILFNGSDHPDTFFTGNTDRTSGILQDIG